MATRKKDRSRDIVLDELARDAWNLNRLDYIREQSAERTGHYLTIERWIWRLGNAHDPDKYETGFQIMGNDGWGDARGAYVTFDRNLTSPRAPAYNPSNKMIYMNLGFDQIVQVRSVLDMIGTRPVRLLYLEYLNGHRWAELYHDWAPA